MAYGNGQRWRHNGRRGPGGDGQRRRLPPADFAAVKACNLIFKAIHHLILTNLAISGEHNMFKKKVNELDSFFKVSGQEKDQTFLANKRQINIQWRTAHLENQKEHFERMLSTEAEVLSKMKLSKGKLKPFLEQGAEWARNSLGKKFSKTDFDQGSAKIYQQASEQANSGNQPAAPAATANTPAPILNPAQRKNPNPGLKPADFLAQRPNVFAKKQEVPRSNAHRDTANTSTPSKRRAEDSPNASPIDNRGSKKPHQDVESPPPPTPPRGPTPSPSENIPPANFTPPPPHQISTEKTVFPPAQNEPSTSNVTGSRFSVLQVEPEPFPTLQESVEQSKKPPRRSSPKNYNQSRIPKPKRKRSDNQGSPSTPPSETGEITPKRAAQTGRANSDASPILRNATGSPNGDTQADAASPGRNTNFSTAPQIKVFPRLNGARGASIKQKWKIPKLTKKTLIIGDENLQRIEKIDDPDTQILSYPELKYSNLKLILDARKNLVEAYKRDPHQNESPGTKPDKVVFLVGHHDKHMEASSFHSNLGAIKPILLNQFGGSQIYFCQVRSSADERHIQNCNDTVEKFCKKQPDGTWTFLPCLPDDIFETDPSRPTLWTPDCAQKVASQIFDRLN